MCAVIYTRLQLGSSNESNRHYCRSGQRTPNERQIGPSSLFLLDKTPILIHTIRKFESCKIVDNIIVARARESVEEIRNLVNEADSQNSFP
jgi:2-C-methyl-D-erythritol 4-phosphate cytidylyltransferase